MEQESFRKKMFSLVLPIAFQQFMLALVSASDAVMLGKLNQDSLSAVSLATQVTFVFNLFLAAFTIGENMYVAQFFGKKDMDGIGKTVGIVLRVTLVVSVLFFLAATVFPAFLMRFFTNEEALIVPGADYLRIVGIYYVLSGITQVFLALMKNCGGVKVSTWISSVTVVLNIVFNAVFIFGLVGAPAMGIRGAALATVLASAVGFLWALIYVKLHMAACIQQIWKKEQQLSKEFWKHTLPVMANEIIWGGGVTMYSVIMGHLGTDAVAANSIANISKNLVVCLCLGLGSAGSIIVGNELGAGRLEQAKKYGRKLSIASILAGVLTGGFLLILSPVILHYVGISDTAREYLKWMLVVCSYYLVGKSINSMTIGGIFPAGGDSRFGLFCDAVTLWCITIPLGALAAFVWKFPVVTVYVILNLDEIVKLPVVYLHYKKYRWLTNLTEKGGEKNDNERKNP